MIPNETECIFQFKKDSLYLYLADGEREIEAMRYAVSNDSLKNCKTAWFKPMRYQYRGCLFMENKRQYS